MTRFHNMPEDQLYKALVGLRASPCFEHLLELLERERTAIHNVVIRSPEPVVIYRAQGRDEEIGRLVQILTTERP